MHNIVIITNKPFPESYASTIRFTSYSEGLIASGFGVMVHCINPTEYRDDIKNRAVKGTHNKIEYRYTSGSTIKSGNKLVRFLVKIYALIVSLVLILKSRKKRRISGILLIGPFGILKELSYYILSRILGIKFIQERTESPDISQVKNLAFNINLWVYKNLSCKLYDAMIVISDALSDYFKKYVSGRARLFVMPIVVDLERFENADTGKGKEQYIGYCGSMQQGKDGVEILIEAFELISSDYPGISLKLIGRKDFPGFDKLSEHVTRLKCGKKIEFTGRVTNEEMVEFLKEAKLLALARPESEQAKYNFPTKIGEYLATGKPVVTTKVGVIPAFLHHGVNAYLAQPGDVRDFAEKMRHILDNYQDALIVGSEGQKLAYREFNHIYQGQRLADFFTSL